MSLRLFPSENRSLELLTSLADTLIEALGAASELLATREGESRALLARLDAAEGGATDLHYALLTHLRTSFVNPLPREDLYAFSRLLHRVVSDVATAAPGLPDLADAAGAHRGERAAELLEILGRQADLARTALAGLGKLESLEDTWLDLLRLSARARSTTRAWSLELSTAQRLSTVIPQQVLARDLERACEGLTSFADQLGHVLVKES